MYGEALARDVADLGPIFDRLVIFWTNEKWEKDFPCRPKA